MEYFFCQNPDIFAFPVNIISGVFLIVGIWTLYRYYLNTLMIRWLTSMSATLIIITIWIGLLIIEGIWAIQLYKSWIFIILEFLLLVILGLIIFRKIHSLSLRNILFLLNHGGLWIILFSALLGAADREEYKMIALLNQPEYNTIDEMGFLHPLPFSVKLDKFELDYYSQTQHPLVPKYFCSFLTLKSKDEEKQISLEVNKPARFKGYTLYQDGYDTARGSASQYTILLVVRDPWLWLVYTGIFMLLTGAIGLIIYGPVKRRKHDME